MLMACMHGHSACQAAACLNYMHVQHISRQKQKKKTELQGKKPPNKKKHFFQKNPKPLGIE
jgi:hypothetical protein